VDPAPETVLVLVAGLMAETPMEMSLHLRSPADRFSF
jgi:hypothetical protein